MHSLRISQLQVLVRQDLAYALSSARGLLFLVFFGIFWFWILYKLSGGGAQWLADPQGNVVVAWLFDAKLAQTLFQQRPPTLSLYYLLAIGSVPLFVLAAASDQTANDIGSRYLRFLIPRCNRLEVFIARFIGVLILVACAYVAVTFAAALISASTDQRSLGEVSGYALQIALALILYSVPFIALMSLCSASVGSAGLSALIGISVYALTAVVISFVSIRWPQIGELLGYLLPNHTKAQFLALGSDTLMSTGLIMPLYVLAYGGAGWLVFRNRDI